MRKIYLLCAALLISPAPLLAQGALGANFNEHFEDVDYPHLKRANAEWIRLFLPMPRISPRGGANGTLSTILEAGAKGYKTILTLKWLFPNRDFPQPGSADFQQQLARLDQVLPQVMGKVDILVIGNEPYIESRPQDRNADLNTFYEGMAAKVIAYRKAHCSRECKTHLYMGALNRLDLPKNRTPSTARWMAFVKATPDIEGVDIHPHVPSLEASRPFLDYILPRMRPDQTFLVTEFSLVTWWRQNMHKPISAAYAAKYNLPRNRLNWQVIRAATLHPFPRQRWDNFLALSPWFESRQHYLRNQMKIFRDTGRLAVATYGFEQNVQMTRNFGPDKIPWLLNSVYLSYTVQPDTGGGTAVNPAWFNDFRALQNK
ncbi:hypothetical protein [Pantoea sp. BAV 3049]|uniref:hypothetical protein n=1 Tax=Pantoea sp. BAV 3049 TaxID=2654188 RepID=UPI0018EF0E4D|nr:hypothetical protein [Pantoea sp. BAV 3049]